MKTKKEITARMEKTLKHMDALFKGPVGNSAKQLETRILYNRLLGEAFALEWTLGHFDIKRL